DRPVTVRPDALAHFAADGRRLAHHLARVERVARGVGAMQAVGLEAGLDAGARRLARRAAIGERGRVAGDVLAREAAQELVHGDAERLAADVPERQVDRALRVDLLAAGRVEVAAVHELPQVLDPRGVLADDQPRDLLDGVARAALADAGQALVGLHGDDRVALVEDRPRLRRLVDADPRDLQTGGRRRRSRGSLRA